MAHIFLENSSSFNKHFHKIHCQSLQPPNMFIQKSTVFCPVDRETQMELPLQYGDSAHDKMGLTRQEGSVTTTNLLHVHDSMLASNYDIPLCCWPWWHPLSNARLKA